MRAIFSTITFAAVFAVTAQQWCPPGAVWVYNYGGFWGADYQAEHRYVGDTLLDGLTADRISVTLAGLGFGGQPIFQEYDEFTRAADGVVYIRDGVQWDTLYWFGAQVGDRWWPIGHPQSCPPQGMLEVVATGDTLINGVALNTISVVEIDEYGAPWTPSWAIVERIGMTPRFPFISDCSVIIDYYNATFLCYSDEDIQLPEGQVCQLTVGVQDVTVRGASITLHPNPGTATFQLTGLGPQPAHLRILDMQGRVVLETNAMMDERPVDASALPAGAYLMEVTTDAGRQVLRWVKE